MPFRERPWWALHSVNRSLWGCSRTREMPTELGDAPLRLCCRLDVVGAGIADDSAARAVAGAGRRAASSWAARLSPPGGDPPRRAPNAT